LVWDGEYRFLFYVVCGGGGWGGGGKERGIAH